MNNATKIKSNFNSDFIDNTYFFKSNKSNKLKVIKVDDTILAFALEETKKI